MLEHALDRAPLWAERWGATGRLVLLLDFDGTLAPIVPHPDQAFMPDETRAGLARLMAMDGVTVGIISGRGLEDVRERAGVPDIAYAGNHGMEIEGPGVARIHPEAVAARGAVERVRDRLGMVLQGIPGAWVEDKRLTLSVHFRITPPQHHPGVHAAVAMATAGEPQLLVTLGKMVLEVRPRVAWNKGRAVLFLLEQAPPPPLAPVLYVGDDRTDEDAFQALVEAGLGEGVLVADPPPETTAAGSFLRNPTEVGRLFTTLANLGPSAAPPQPEG
jgi:trehalose 6-phosphate phosphatase